MYVCILRQDSEVMLNRDMQARLDTLLQAITPSQDALVIAVACSST